MDTEIEAVVFDFGGVLTRAPLDGNIETLRALCGLDRPTFDREYRLQRFDYDRGTVDSLQYWTRIMSFGGAAPTQQSIRSLIEEDTAGWTRPNEAVLAWAWQLQEVGVRTAILSNMPRDILVRIQDRFDWIKRFEVRIFSCNLGTIKPEAEIYQACMEALELKGSKILFLDDSSENVKAARRSGMRAILFRELVEALRQIAQKGWLPALQAAKQEQR